MSKSHLKDGFGIANFSVVACIAGMCVSFIVEYGHGVRWITIEFTIFRRVEFFSVMHRLRIDGNPDDPPEVMSDPPTWADPKS